MIWKFSKIFRIAELNRIRNEKCDKIKIVICGMSVRMMQNMHEWKKLWCFKNANYLINPRFHNSNNGKSRDLKMTDTEMVARFISHSLRSFHWNSTLISNDKMCKENDVRAKRHEQMTVRKNESDFLLCSCSFSHFSLDFVVSSQH